jgi:hypothetical protein
LYTAGVPDKMKPLCLSPNCPWQWFWNDFCSWTAWEYTECFRGFKCKIMHSCGLFLILILHYSRDYLVFGLSVCLFGSVCNPVDCIKFDECFPQYAWNTQKPLDRFSWNLILENFFVESYQFHFDWTLLLSTLHEDLPVFLRVSLAQFTKYLFEWKIFFDKCCRE